MPSLHPGSWCTFQISALFPAHSPLDQLGINTFLFSKPGVFHLFHQLFIFHKCVFCFTWAAEDAMEKAVNVCTWKEHANKCWEIKLKVEKMKRVSMGDTQQEKPRTMPPTWKTDMTSQMFPTDSHSVQQHRVWLAAWHSFHWAVYVTSNHSFITFQCSWGIIIQLHNMAARSIACTKTNIKYTSLFEGKKEKKTVRWKPSLICCYCTFVSLHWVNREQQEDFELPHINATILYFLFCLWLSIVLNVDLTAIAKVHTSEPLDRNFEEFQLT